LIASNAGTFDRFGSGLAVSGDRVVVGAPGEDTAGGDAGAAYVFLQNWGGTDNWGEVEQLTASDADADDLFGGSLSMSGDTAVVGAASKDSLPSQAAGAAYVLNCADVDGDSICNDNDDSDGDGCTDAQELASDPTLGGQRDYLNPWDYFNPSEDGLNRIDDITAVVLKYGHDLGVYGDYDTKFDRTELTGGNPWQFDAPDGQIRIFDITAAIRSYAHDCGPYP
jgi:hypothetical protein